MRTKEEILQDFQQHVKWYAKNGSLDNFGDIDSRISYLEDMILELMSEN